MVAIQVYDNCYPFVWSAWAFDLAIYLVIGTLRLEFSWQFGILLFLLFPEILMKYEKNNAK